MLIFKHLKPSDYRTVPWRNHLGTTAEIAIYPEGSNHHDDSFEWRISSASISSSCPFSQFLGYDRSIVVVEGEGIALNHDCVESAQSIKRLEPYQFKGEWQTTCEIGDGPVRDLNVMMLRGKCSSEMKVLRPSGKASPEKLDGERALLYCVSGSLEINGPGAHALLAPDESLMIQAGTDFPIEITIRAVNGSSEAILIQIHSKV